MLFLVPHHLLLVEFNKAKSGCGFFAPIFKIQYRFMKQLLFVLLTFPSLVFAQDCGLKKETDQFTQQPLLSTGFIKFAGGGGRYALNLVADAKEVRLLFSFGDGVCFDDQSTAAFSFDSSRSKSTQRNASSMNCDGIFTIVFRNAAITPGTLQKLTAQKISSLVFTDNTQKKIQITLREEEKQWLREKAACLVNEAKALIKP